MYAVLLVIILFGKALSPFLVVLMMMMMMMTTNISYIKAVINTIIYLAGALQHSKDLW